MIFISAKAQHLCPHLVICLLNLLLLAECDRLRLVGPSRCSGRVELFHRDTWVTLCDDQWGLANAHVVCREVNCGTAVEVKQGSFFGGKTSLRWAYTAQCSGGEASILECPRRRVERAKCNHRKEAGVICSDNVKLSNGSNHCNGRVEVYHNGDWKKVCGKDWSQEDAEVVCQEINCGMPVPDAETQQSGEERELVGVTTNCFGNETSFAQCSLQEFRGNCSEASVFCTDTKPIQLVNGTSRCSGRVEVLSQREWGSVCDDSFGMAEATVVCRQMTCGVPLAVKKSAYFGIGQGRILLDDVDCTGSEMALSQCPHKGSGQHNCEHNEDAGVICSETIRLINGADLCSGRLEVFHKDQWVQMCNNNWGLTEATTVCRELGCGDPKMSTEIPSFSGGMALNGFTGRCSKNVSSITQCDLQEHSGSCEVVAISCSAPQVRLVNGSDQCSGRVEILHNGVWGSVCDDGWDIRDAEVVCREMGCGTAQLAQHGASFGQGQGNIWLSQLDCHGNESSLSQCQHPLFGGDNCGHADDAGVVCSASIRLINGDNLCSGRVEFFHAGYWSAVNTNGWGMNEATVVCREMHCGEAVKISVSFGQSAARRGYTISCTGSESSLADCRLKEFVRSSRGQTADATVVCSGNVRLVGGNNRCDGRVEFHDKGQWGTVCGESWEKTDAEVVCKQLDCGEVWKTGSESDYGVGTGHTWAEKVECTGKESSLTACRQIPFEDKTCSNNSIADVVCSDSLVVRLVDGHDQCSGRLEVRHGSVWQTVCDADYTSKKGAAVCALLHCGTNASTHSGAHFGKGSGAVVEASGACFDNASSLLDCSRDGFRASSCGHDRDVGVTCSSELRLVNHTTVSKCAGRVELFFRGQWGTVCTSSWPRTAAEVVCRQLGCGKVSGSGLWGYFGRGNGPRWLNQVSCSGNESFLTMCPHTGYAEGSCTSGQDAGVICSDSLSKPKITMTSGPEVHLGDSKNITCSTSMFDRGMFNLKNSKGISIMSLMTFSGEVTFNIKDADFSHAGAYFCEFRTHISSEFVKLPAGDPMTLIVTVAFEKPNATLKSSQATEIEPDRMMLTPGRGFSITCALYSKYGDGFFYLTEAEANTTEAEPAFGHKNFHKAVFEFPEMETTHHGSYSCVYGVNISSMFFRSKPSNVIQVSVHVSRLSPAVTGVISVLVILLVLAVIYLLWRRTRRRTQIPVGSTAPNRFQGMTRWDSEDKDNIERDDRDQLDQIGGQSCTLAKTDDVDEAESCERSVENLPGRVSYELEPLVRRK